MSRQAIWMLIYKMKQLADEPNYTKQMKLNMLSAQDLMGIAK